MRAFLYPLALCCAFVGIGLLKYYRREPDAFWWPIAGLVLGVAGAGLLVWFRIKDISTVSFRPGVPEDGLALLSIHTRAIAMVGVDDYGPEVARSWAHGLTAQGYGRVMKGGEVFEVAVIDGMVIGFCSIKPGVICGLFVDPDFMRRGVATQLLSHALAWMKAQGCARVEIEATLTAVPFLSQARFPA